MKRWFNWNRINQEMVMFGASPKYTFIVYIIKMPL